MALNGAWLRLDSAVTVPWIVKGPRINELTFLCTFSCALEDSDFKVCYSSAAVLRLGLASGAPCMLPGCVLSTPWIQLGCSLDEPWTGLGRVVSQL